MLYLRYLLRKKHSKGHGIHSPFAFDLITNVLYSPYIYYAFTDIPNLLPDTIIQSKREKRFNRTSFCLINHFKALNILEINPGDGINTLYIKSPISNINYSSLPNIGILNSVEDRKFDAIFINLNGDENSDNYIETLLNISHQETFWVINPIKTKVSKQFCELIVKHERVTITFDISDSLIAFLRSSFYKHHYFV